MGIAVAGATMNILALGIVGLILAATWLALLVVTGFNTAVVGAGLLIVLSISGSTRAHLRP